MTLDYSPWSEREIWPFLRVAVSPKPEGSRPPKLVCMHLTSIPTYMNFLSQFRSIKFFDDHRLRVVICTKPKRPHLSKLTHMYTLSNTTCTNFLSQFYFFMTSLLSLFLPSLFPSLPPPSLFLFSVPLFSIWKDILPQRRKLYNYCSKH